MTINRYAERLESADCVLFLIDIQKSMLDLCPDRQRVVKNSAALITIADQFGIPILLSQHNAAKLGGFLPELVERAAAPTVLDKLEFSCFENPAMADAVAKTGRETLLLAGIETHVCIFHTAAHALRLGFKVQVAADAVASRSELNWRVGLDRLDRAGGVISSTEMIIFELLQRAGTDQFRAALPLLKTL